MFTSSCQQTAQSNAVPLRGAILVALIVGSMAVSPSNAARPIPSSCGDPVASGCQSGDECGWPKQVYCMTPIPCSCDALGHCHASFEVMPGPFDRDESFCYCIYKVGSVCATAYTCISAQSSSCANDDACDPFGNGLPVPRDIWVARLTSCQ